MSVNEASRALKVPVNGKKQPASLSSCPSLSHQLPSMWGVMGVAHRVVTFPTSLVHSSAKANPFVLEVTPRPKKESVFSDKTLEAIRKTCTESLIDGKAEGITDGVHQPSAIGIGVSKCPPVDDLLRGCSKTTVSAAKDQESDVVSSDVVGAIGLGPDTSEDNTGSGETGGTCNLDCNAEDADSETEDNLDEPCSSDEYDSCTDEGDNESEYDPVEFDCGTDSGAPRSWDHLPPCVEVSPPKEGDLPLRGPRQSYRKLLSEESGYCEGTSSEEGGKAECSGGFRLSETLEDDEVDWDNSDDSG